MGNVLCEPAWLETRKITFPVAILLLCSSYNIVEYEGESSAVPEKSQVIWDRFCVNGVCMAQTLLLAELWSSYIVVNAGVPFGKFPLEYLFWQPWECLQSSLWHPLVFCGFVCFASHVPVCFPEMCSCLSRSSGNIQSVDM